MPHPVRPETEDWRRCE